MFTVAWMIARRLLTPADIVIIPSVGSLASPIASQLQDIEIPSPEESSPQIWVTPALTVHKRQPDYKFPLACERRSASFSGETCGHLGVKHRTKRGQRQSKSSSARPEEPSSESHHFGAFIADSVPRIRQASRRSVPDLELVQNKRLLTTHLFIAWGTILSHDQGLYCSFFENQVYIRKWVNSWFIIW